MALYFMPKYIKTDKNFPVLSIDDVGELNKLSSLTEQIKRLTTYLELPPDDLQKRQAACEEVLQILRKFYPDASVLMYGLSVNSFGIKGCDMDLLFMPFPKYSNLDNMVTEGEEMAVPDPAAILNGEASKDVLTKLDEPTHLKFIRAALRQEKYGKRANMIMLPKFLFLKLFLKNNNFICNISASNKLIVHKSELLQFYSTLDDRVKPLVICLLYWARSLGFIKRSFFFFDSFTLLIIFFLQSVYPPVLPSIQQLAETAGFSRKIAGWETAFCTDAKKVPKSKNTLSVGELLVQFFNFYVHFDFSQSVVSPHSGRALPIKDIQNSKDARMADFMIKPMNIQDMFVLSNNVSGVEKLGIFKLALLTSHEILKDKGKMQFPAFFNPDAYQHLLDLHYNRYVYNCKKFITAGGASKIQSCFIHLDYHCIQKLGSLEMWYFKASEAVYDILQYGLLMECEVTDKVDGIMKKGRSTFDSVNGKGSFSGKNKNASVSPLESDKNAKPSTPYDLQLLISMQCLMYSRVHGGRKNVEVKTPDSQNDLEVNAGSVLGKEHYISKHLIEKNSMLKSSAPIVAFNCECYRHANPELTDLVVMLKPLTTAKEFAQVSQFLVAYLPEVVKKMVTSD